MTRATGASYAVRAVYTGLSTVERRGGRVVVVPGTRPMLSRLDCTDRALSLRIRLMLKRMKTTP